MADKYWWVQRRPENLCCDEFWHAMQHGTDAELELVRYQDCQFRIGNKEMRPIVFCPWCGGKPRGPE